MNSNDGVAGASPRQIALGVTGVVVLLTSFLLLGLFGRRVDIAWHFPRYDQTAEATVESHGFRRRSIRRERRPGSFLLSLPYYAVKVDQRVLLVNAAEEIPSDDEPTFKFAHPDGDTVTIRYTSDATCPDGVSYEGWFLSGHLTEIGVPRIASWSTWLLFFSFIPTLLLGFKLAMAGRSPRWR